MSTDVYTVRASQLTLGPLLARGSPGITLYEADLSLGGHITKVCIDCTPRFRAVLGFC